MLKKFTLKEYNNLARCDLKIYIFEKSINKNRILV